MDPTDPSIPCGDTPTEEGDGAVGGEIEAVGLFSPGEESVDKGALSPLTGSYLLIVLAEPHSEEDRDIIIKRLTKGLRSWDVDSTHVDLSCELLNLANAAPEGDEARNGEKLVQWASENLVVEVLIHCQVNTLLQCMKNLLSSFTRHRHIIHAGYTFQGTGSWILQDGTFSFTDFVELWEEPEVTRILGAYRGDISVSMHCAEENGWTDDRLGRESFTKLCQVRMNPPELLLAHSSGIITFVDYISKLTTPATLKEILEPSEIVGNIRFSRPTLYVFPGGQGDAALFGVNGFNMLIDGGFSRRSCFWDFTRHLDRLDAVLLTRVNNNAVGGLDSVLDRKRLNQVYPQIGHFFGNVMERKHPEMEKTGEAGELLVSLTETGQRMLDNLRSINIRPQHCFRDHTIEPINLYHKVGHGKLDMYVLNPAKDSREVREFMSKWNTDCKSFVQARMSVKVEGKEMNYPVLNLVSICALLVWQPDNQRDPITRILFPGSTPQQKIFEALGKLRHLEFLKYPVCSAKTIAASHKSRVKSEKIVSEAKSQFSTSGIVKDKSGNNGETVHRTPVQRAPSESRVSSKYSSVRSKISSSARSDSSSTIQTLAGDVPEKEHKGRERSREKRKVTSSSSTTKSVDRDNKAVESEVKKTERVSSSRRVDSGLSKTSSAAKLSSTSTTTASSKVSSKVTSRIDTGKKSGQVSGVTSPPSRDPSSIPKTKASTAGVPSTKYGIGVARTVVSKASAGSTASPPPTPPKSAKEATNRKVIEHKTQSTRKSLVDTAKSKDKASIPAQEIKQKVTSSSTKSTPPAAKTTIPRPSTASSAGKKAGANNNEPVAVKRPSMAGSKAAVAIGAVAAAGAAAVSAVLTSSSSSPKDEHIGTNGHGESGPEKENVDENVAKSPVEIEIVDQNGLGLSVPVTESSSELSSLEHVSVTDELEETGGATGSEEIITELYKEQGGTGGDMQSETHTITEPGAENYDEEDEYLIIEKDESAGAEEINIDSNLTSDEQEKESFTKEEAYQSQEKEVDEEKDVEELADDHQVKESVDEEESKTTQEAVDKIKESVDEEIKESNDDEMTKDNVQEQELVEEEVVEKQKAYTDQSEVADAEEEIPEKEKSRKEEFEEGGIEIASEESLVTQHLISEPEKEVRGPSEERDTSSGLSDRLSEEREQIYTQQQPKEQVQEAEKELPREDEKELIPESGHLPESSLIDQEHLPITEEKEIQEVSDKEENKSKSVEDDAIDEIKPTEISDLSKSPDIIEEPVVSQTAVKEKQRTPEPPAQSEEIIISEISEISKSEIPKAIEAEIKDELETKVSLVESHEQIDEEKAVIETKESTTTQKEKVEQVEDNETKAVSDEIIESKVSSEIKRKSETLEPEEIKAEEVVSETESEFPAEEEHAEEKEDQDIEQDSLPTTLDMKSDSEIKEKESDSKPEKHDEKQEIKALHEKSDTAEVDKEEKESEIHSIEEPVSKSENVQDSVQLKDQIQVQEEESSSLTTEINTQAEIPENLQISKDQVHTRVKRSLIDEEENEKPEETLTEETILKEMHSPEKLSAEQPEIASISKLESESEIKVEKLDTISDHKEPTTSISISGSDKKETTDLELVQEELQVSEEEHLQKSSSFNEMKASVECVTLKDLDTEKETKSKSSQIIIPTTETDTVSERQDSKSDDGKDTEIDSLLVVVDDTNGQKTVPSEQDTVQVDLSSSVSKGADVVDSQAEIHENVEAELHGKLDTLNIRRKSSGGKVEEIQDPDFHNIEADSRSLKSEEADDEQGRQEESQEEIVQGLQTQITESPEAQIQTESAVSSSNDAIVMEIPVASSDKSEIHDTTTCIETSRKSEEIFEATPSSKTDATSEIEQLPEKSDESKDEQIKESDETKNDTEHISSDEIKVHPTESDHHEELDEVKEHVDKSDEVKEHVEKSDEVKEHAEKSDELKGDVEKSNEVKDHLEKSDEVKEHIEKSDEVKDKDDGEKADRVKVESESVEEIAETKPIVEKESMVEQSDSVLSEGHKSENKQSIEDEFVQVDASQVVCSTGHEAEIEPSSRDEMKGIEKRPSIHEEKVLEESELEKFPTPAEISEIPAKETLTSSQKEEMIKEISPSQIFDSHSELEKEQQQIEEIKTEPTLQILTENAQQFNIPSPHVEEKQVLTKTTAPLEVKAISIESRIESMKKGGWIETETEVPEEEEIDTIEKDTPESHEKEVKVQEEKEVPTEIIEKGKSTEHVQEEIISTQDTSSVGVAECSQKSEIEESAKLDETVSVSESAKETSPDSLRTDELDLALEQHRRRLSAANEESIKSRTGGGGGGEETSQEEIMLTDEEGKDQVEIETSRESQFGSLNEDDQPTDDLPIGDDGLLDKPEAQTPIQITQELGSSPTKIEPTSPSNEIQSTPDQIELPVTSGLLATQTLISKKQEDENLKNEEITSTKSATEHEIVVEDKDENKQVVEEEEKESDMKEIETESKENKIATVTSAELAAKPIEPTVSVKTQKTGEETTSSKPVAVPSAIPPKIPRESREVIRTPDEVADLPVHEEVEPGTYETDFYHENRQEKERRAEEDEEEVLTSADIRDQMEKSAGVQLAEHFEEKPEEIVSGTTTATAPGTITCTTAPLTTFTSSVTHTTKDEESPAPQSDDFRISVDDKLTTEEKAASKSSEKSEVEEEKVEEEKVIIEALDSLPAGVVEKIDAAVSPVLESLLTKSVGKTLEKATVEANDEICAGDEIHGEKKVEHSSIPTTTISAGKGSKADGVESDKYSTTAAQLLEGEESGTMHKSLDGGEVTSKEDTEPKESVDAPFNNTDEAKQIDEKRDEDLVGEMELEGLQTNQESIPFVAQKSGVITSVVITPSTPPVQVTDEGHSLFPMPLVSVSSGDKTTSSEQDKEQVIADEILQLAEGRLTPEEKVVLDEKYPSDVVQLLSEDIKSISDDKLHEIEVVEKLTTEDKQVKSEEEKVEVQVTYDEKPSSIKDEAIHQEVVVDVKPEDLKITALKTETDKISEEYITTEEKEIGDSILSKPSDDKSPSGSTLLVEETKMCTSEESSSSSALTAILETSKQIISSISKTEDETDHHHHPSALKSPSQPEIVEENREKLFFLPRDEDDEEDDENEDEGRDDDNNISTSIIAGLGTIGAGLLTAANTLNAPVVHQSTEEIATIPTPERQRSPETSPQISEELIKSGESLEKSDLYAEVGQNSDKSEPELFASSPATLKEHVEIEEVRMESGDISSPQVDADKNKSEDAEEESKSAILKDLKPDDHKASGGNEEEEDELDVSGKSVVSAIGETITSSAGVILGSGQEEALVGIFPKSQHDKSSSSSTKVVFLESGPESGGEEPISETLIETAHSAVSSALESATETISVAHETVDQVQKSAQEKLNTLKESTSSDLHDDKDSEVIEHIILQSEEPTGSQIQEETFTATTSKLQECSKAVENVADKICDSMKNIHHDDCAHETDEEDDRPEVVEELCTKTIKPPRVIPQDDDDNEDKDEKSGKKTPVDIIKSSMKTIHQETPDEDTNQDETAEVVLTTRTDAEIEADLEEQMMSDTFGFVVDKKDIQKTESEIPSGTTTTTTTTTQLEFTKDTTGNEAGQIKSPIIDTEEPMSEEPKSTIGDKSISQQIEAEPVEGQKKRKELIDYIGTIKEAKAVFDTLLNVAKSGAALSSAVEECKQNAVEAIRRHLEEANEVYRPVNRDPVAPDSPVEEEEGITIYESLEQMALAGSELFTGLVEKIEKDIEEQAQRKEENKPETPDETQRRLSAELAVNAALQHLHETFKTMQTMGSPKRSSFHAATCKRHLRTSNNGGGGGDQQEEDDDLRSASSGRFSQSAMTSSLHFSTSATLAESAVKSPDDETERSEGETMRESMASFTSGVGSETDDRAEFMATSVTESSVTLSHESDATEKVETHSSSEVKEESSSSITTKLHESQTKEEMEIHEKEISMIEKVSELSSQEFSTAQSQSSEFISSSRKISSEESKLESFSESKSVQEAKSITESSATSYGVTKDAKMSSVSSEIVELGESHNIISLSEQKVSSGIESVNRNVDSSMTFVEESSKSSKKWDEDHSEDVRKVVYYEEENVGEEPSSLQTVTTTTSVSPATGSVTRTALTRRFSSSTGEPLDETTTTMQGDAPSASAKLGRRASEVQSSQFSGAAGYNVFEVQGDVNKSYATLAEQVKKGEADSADLDPRPLSDFGYQTRESGDEESGSYQSAHGYSTMIIGGHEESLGHHSLMEETLSGDPVGSTTVRTVKEESSDLLGGSGVTKTTTTTTNLRTVTAGDLSDFQKSTLASSDLSGFQKSTIVRTISEDVPSGSSVPSFERSSIVRTVSQDSGALPSGYEKSTVVRTISEGSSSFLPEFDKSSSSTIRTVTTTSGTGGEEISSGGSKSTIISSTGGHQYYPAFPQDILEEEAYSSGDFSDSQPSSIPTGHVETDEEVQNYDSSSKVDVDNGNFTTTSVVTSDNGSVTTQTSVTSVSSGDNGNMVTQTTRVVTTSRTVVTEEPNLIPSSSEVQEASQTSSSTTGTSSHSDILKEWGKPLGLPVVYTEGAEGGSNGGGPDSGNFGGKATPKKTAAGGSKGPGTPAKSASSSKEKRSSSRKSRQSPIYVDLAYVPHHGNSHYCDSEFFRMIRGRYYVFSGLEPSREVFEGLLQGKQQWEDKNLETTVIPTYDTDTLGYWVGDSEKELAEAKIDLAPSASRCTINLQDHETSCAAYRLEF